MTIFKDAYKTTVGSILSTKAIEHAIKEFLIREPIRYDGNVTLANGNFKPLFITGSLSSESNIPLFTHPITILNFNQLNYLCTDLRLFIRNGTPIEDIDAGIKNKTEFNFTKSRSILNLIWLNEGIGQIKTSLSFAGIVFAAWLSEAISKNYALDFKDQNTLAIITSYYYQTLFIDEVEITEDMKQKMAAHTIKATQAPAKFVFEIFDKIGSLKDINDYCSAVERVLENTRIKDFNLLVLLTIVKNSWYGTNAKEIISVALEHPPTWCAIVYTALSEKTYKSSMIYRISERYGKRGASDEFIKNYVGMVKDQISVSTEEQIVIRDFD